MGIKKNIYAYSTNKKNNFSKISQELFWGILEKEPNLIDRDIYFATYKNELFKKIYGDDEKLFFRSENNTPPNREPTKLICSGNTVKSVIYSIIF